MRTFRPKVRFDELGGGWMGGWMRQWVWGGELSAPPLLAGRGWGEGEDTAGEMELRMRNGELIPVKTDWSDTETDGTNGKIKHLWEESWDDDDTSDDFAAQLRYAPIHLLSRKREIFLHESMRTLELR